MNEIDYSEDKKSLINRLKRVEGQIRGVTKMLENDEYCPNILIQVSAATAALNSFSKSLLTEYLKTTVAGDLRDGKTESLDDLVLTVRKMFK